MSTKSSSSKKTKKSVDLPLGKAPAHEEEIDLSHLQLPIETSVFGLKQVLTLFETATNEVKRYLAYECSILYECRVCRKIFRSLANFILHKRVYCRTKYSSSEYHSRECRKSDGLSIITREIEVVNEIVRENENSDDDEPRNKLIPVIEKLIQKQEHKKFVDNTKNEDLSRTTESRTRKEPFNSVLLEPINTSDVAVFQTTGSSLNLKNEEFMKTEVMEIHSILNDDEAIIGSDGKIINTSRDKKKDELKNSLICTECNQKFSTKKTLIYHVKNKHNDSRIVYPCPECNDDLANAWSVYRHLLKVHKKTASQIRKCRNQIFNSAVCKKVQELQIKSKKDKTENRDENDEENEWLDNVEGDNDLQMCGGCGKRFERRAALASHSVMCTKRIAICNTIKGNNAKKKEMDERETRMKRKIKLNKEQISGSAKRKPDCLINYKIKNYNSNVRSVDNSEEIVTLTSEDDSEIEENVIRDTELEEIEEKIELPSKFLEENVQLSDRSDSPCKGFENTEPFEIIFNGRCENEENFVEIKPELKIEIIEPSVTSKDDVTVTELETESIKIEKEHPQEEESSQLNKSSELIIIEDSSGIYSTNSIEIEEDNSSNFNKSTDDDENQNDEFSNFDDNTNVETLEPSNDPLKNKRKRSTSSGNLKKSKKPNENEDDVQDDETFISKISQHIDKINFGCVICESQFSSMSNLLLHMSIHFSWYRYQCTKCSYMSYSRHDCESHVHKEHQVPIRTMNCTVFPIPAWKTIAMSKNIDNVSPIDDSVNVKSIEELLMNNNESRDIITQAEMNNVEASKEDEIIVGFIDLTNDLDDDNEDEKRLAKTEITRDMSKQDILNVILGNDVRQTDKTDDEIQCSSNENNMRPQRNRVKSVKCSQKDFIYDMDVIGSKMLK